MGDRGCTIVADDAIGRVREAFGGLGQLVTLPGRAIDRAAISAAQALIVRTVTRVDASLVRGTPVRFVGSATAGHDHLDLPGLAALGVTVAHAPGCNATAVAEYVLAALAMLSLHSGGSFPAEGPVGVVGFGCVGRRLTRRLRALGADVLVCDPPLAASRQATHEPDPRLLPMIAHEDFVELPDLLSACAVVTMHVPRVSSGPFPTLHLLGAEELEQLRPGAIVVNTARGGVLDDAALRSWLERGGGQAVLDVWEDEPAPSEALLDRVALATPHIAGYSLEGKLEATRRVHVALARLLGHAPTFDPLADLRTRGGHPIARHMGAADDHLVAAAITDAMNLGEDDTALRRALASAGHDPAARGAAFEALRRGYRFRRELSAFSVAAEAPSAVQAALSALGVRPSID